MFHLDHRDSRPIYEQIADAIRRQITASILTPGEKLPSVRELSASLTINPNTIQRAYRELEQQGWIVSEPGRGSFVTTRTPETEKDLWADFDRAAEALLASGIPQEELIDRIKQKGGLSYA